MKYTIIKNLNEMKRWIKYDKLLIKVYIKTVNMAYKLCY